MRSRSCNTSFLAVTILCLLALSQVACATRLREVGLPLPKPAPVHGSPLPISAALVIGPQFANHVLHHTDQEWVTFFRIHAGPYASAKLRALATSSFANSFIVEQLSELPSRGQHVDYALVPAFTSFALASPPVHAYQDAYLEVAITVRILDGESREIATLAASGFAEGTFGRGGANVDRLAMMALDNMCENVWHQVLDILRRQPSKALQLTPQ